jgi:hypothetical protein
MFSSTVKLLMTDFVNHKIKSIQSFRCAHRGMVCICIHRSECSYVYKYLCLYCVSKKIKQEFNLYCSDYTNERKQKSLMICSKSSQSMLQHIKANEQYL